MWDDFVAWFQSPAGQRVLDAAVIPALAILVAGVVAALIARGAVRSLLAKADRAAVAGVAAALVEVARALGAGTPPGAERERIERLRAEADVRLRLSGAAGAAIVADWASLRLDALERDTGSPAPQRAAGVEEVRDRLLAWVARPRRAKRLFGADVERLGAERDARRAAQRPAAAKVDDRPVPAVEQEPTDEARPDSAATTTTPPPEAGPDREPVGEGRPEPIAARAQNLAHELQAERARVAGSAATAAGSAEGAPSPTTEPVLIQRTRLDSMDRQAVDARFDHARHARPGEGAPIVAEAPADPPPAPEVLETEPEPAEAAAPVGERQATPAWLDVYDDEAEVTRDIDLSKTPPPKAASAVRDRTHTGDDIVPRH